MLKFNRLSKKSLVQWKNRSTRMPLLVRGARQIGKSFLVEAFGHEYFKNTVTVNLEQKRELHPLFASLDPQKIILALSAVLDTAIIPGETLLFIDEIQNSKDALMSLRYFYEQLPTLHVIAAGSLLEFALSDDDFSMPVGRIEYLYLYPMNFQEFLLANGADNFLNFIQNIHPNDVIPDAVHQRGLELSQLYCLLGGMPKVQQTYINTQNLKECQHIQGQIINTYFDDFGKYGKKIDPDLCQIIFTKAPTLIAKHFKYIDVDPDTSSTKLKPALQALTKAGLYRFIYSTLYKGLPLNNHIIYKKFKLLFLDVGLIKHMGRLDAELMLSGQLESIYQGRLSEQWVGQELLTYQETTLPPELFFWERNKKNSTAELDYLLQIQGKIAAVEVKSGHSNRLKSLQLFLEENSKNPSILPFGIKISKDSFGKSGNVLSLPFYMISELERITQEYLG